MSICKKFAAALVALLAFALTSCMVVQEQPVGPQGAVDGVKYNRFSGGMTAKLGCSMFEADRAVIAAAKKHQLLALTRRNQQRQIVYEYKNIYEDRVDFALKEREDGVWLFIKMGKSGNRAFSRQLLTTIAELIPVQEVQGGAAE